MPHLAVALAINQAEDFSPRDQQHILPTSFQWPSPSAPPRAKQEPSTQCECGNGSHNNTLVSFTHAQHVVESSVRGIIVFLARHEVFQGCVEELKKLEAQRRYIDLMGRAEKYIECLCAVHCKYSPHPFDVDAIVALFVIAWASLIEHSNDLFRKARAKYSKYQNQLWKDNQHLEEYIVAKGLSEWEQEGLKRWHKTNSLSSLDPKEEPVLRAELALATRFKMDCQKGLVLTKEWARYLKAQQQKRRQKPAHT